MSDPPALALAGELSKIDKLLLLLGEDAEPQLILDTVEGETNALEMLDAIVETILADEGYIDIIKARITRLEARSNRRRAIVLEIMQRMGLRTAKRPMYTASVTDGPKSVHITDEKLIPMHLHRVAPDKVAIAKVLKDGGIVDGAQLNNAPPVLRILR